MGRKRFAAICSTNPALFDPEFDIADAVAGRLQRPKRDQNGPIVQRSHRGLPKGIARPVLEIRRGATAGGDFRGPDTLVNQ